MENPTIFVDMDQVVSDFDKQYKETFGRDPDDDGNHIVRQNCLTKPRFFRDLPPIEKGLELVDLLKDDYKVVFLTTPMPGLEWCRRDKVDWIRKHIGDYDVIFSDNKAEYVVDDKSILIDDMKHNLESWNDAGGTAINITNPIDKIFEIIEETLYGIEAVNEVKQQLENIVVNLQPTEKQKRLSNYKKGQINFKGLDIMIENTPGSIRWGFGDDNKKWISKMKHYYGYIKGTEGNDYDSVDCFIGPKLNASRVFVVNQLKGGLFDECKAILGANDIDEARDIYLANYKKGQENNIHSIVQTNTKKFRSWLKLKSKEPFK